jgi:UPF0755 protein
VKFLRRLIFFAVFLMAGLVVGAYAWLHQPLTLSADAVEVSIELRTSPKEMAAAWVQGGVKVQPFWLYQWFRWSGQARKIRAGSYQIERGTTPIMLLDKMVRGEELMFSSRLIEGWTLRQFRLELAKAAPQLVATTAQMSEPELMAALGAPAGQSGEGRFYPDTYAFSKGVSDLVVLKRAYSAMQRHLESVWAQRSADTLVRDTNELLTLASIVEKETAAPAERGQVAGVFMNRLRLGMPLQTDPTVIYGLGERFDGKIYKRDLLADTPYNTYTRKGLPPTPIAMPGRAALLAVAQPPNTRALYFVAKGNGASQFSETLIEHQRAVNQYQRSAGTR